MPKTADQCPRQRRHKQHACPSTKRSDSVGGASSTTNHPGEEVDVYLKNCGVKPSSASIEASCAHRAPKDPYPHRPAIHEKVGKVGAYARRQAALRATVIPILQRERAADHIDEDAKLQPKVHNRHSSKCPEASKVDVQRLQMCRGFKN